MNDVLFWFSATGNSRFVADRIAEGLGGAESHPMATSNGREARDSTSVGIAFPVYYFGLPLYVLDFLSRIDVRPDAYVYAVATMGGAAGVAHHEASRILGERGIALAAGWSVKMPGNYTPLYGAPSARRQQRCFVAAQEKATAIAAAVRARQPGRLEDSCLAARLLCPPLRRAAGRRIPTRDQAFTAGAHCTSCGTCEQVCPVQNVKLVDGRPVWEGHCQECMACLQWCPVEAIEAGWITRGRRRYRHPGFAAEDFMLRRDGE